MVFSENMLEAQKALQQRGHTVYVSGPIAEYIGLTEEAKTTLTLHHKNTQDAMRHHCALIEKSDAIVVLNYDRKGIAGYIGGNTFLEIGYAHIFHKKIYLLNSIPEIKYYQSEIEAMQPKILHGDLMVISN